MQDLKDQKNSGSSFTKKANELSSYGKKEL
jgi:hypothetical protein